MTTTILDDVRLPEKWSKGSSGGPEFLTGLVPLAGGGEYRPRRWTNPLHRYDIAHNVRKPEDIAELRSFHFARNGRHRGFLLKDWLDWTSASDGQSAPMVTDQSLGTGDGVETQFQLVKRYADAINPFDRPVAFPVVDTLLIAADGTPMASGWSVERGTGLVTFTAAPAIGAVLTAGFAFDVPIRFDDDWLSISWDTINSRSAGSVPLQEVRGPWQVIS
ncbi:DUF2460 domain-containing protein [Novosphingobium mangrovi (ex Huang et al. 2023)]|uniref:DUF2460 domain-containing protein n=1 Tax=Novosphingobium mangrovi (ex Huang et al. 2023) TaxID=2976432 RepID=A0ABT2I1P2_9SPHN|nr:DUF2460 domain-containing protein [Novosphingobium mangrovi (ex Huang et al. 2023)]MCT2398532.1 DUF2460 domain-containing protein [Novosphingobium mangrovi (ex Huang et al. 2023)]